MSSLVSKTVTGTLKYADGTVWPSGKIVFTPIAVFGSTPVTVPVKEFSVFTGADGTFSIVLYSYDDASVAYNCLLPSGDEFNFNLPQGSGSTTLETLRRLSYTPPETGYSHSALTDLDEDDHPQYLTEARADLLYEPLGGGGGGVTDHGALTGLGDDDHTQYFNTARGDARYSLLGHNHSGTYQPANSDLSAIAALTPTNDDVLQRKAGAWVNRTPAQLKADLALSKSDVGLSNVPNADATARANHSGTQLAATISDFAATVRSTVLTGLGTGTDTPIAATDTLLAALENLQAQIDGIGGASSPLTLTANSASEVPLTIQLASSQTANAFQVKDSSANVEARITGGGRFAQNFYGSLIWTSDPGNGYGLFLTQGYALVFGSGGVGTAGFRRFADNVMASSPGTTYQTSHLMGGGTALASQAALDAPTGNVFHVTGTTGITSITSTNFQSGVVITLIFDASVTVTDGGNLRLAGDFSATADDTLTLVYDGSNWYEIARSVN